jgi:hypothetical protein
MEPSGARPEPLLTEPKPVSLTEPKFSPGSALAGIIPTTSVQNESNALGSDALRPI